MYSKISKKLGVFVLSVLIFISCSSLEDAESLNREGKKQEAFETAEPYLESDDPKEREKAAMIMGEIGSQKAGQALMRVLEDPVSDVQIAALESIGEIGHQEAADKLIELIPKVKGDVFEALAKAIGGVGKLATDKLVKKFTATVDPDKKIKKMVIEVGPSITASLIDALESKSYFESRHIFDALVELKNPKVARYMLPYLDDEEVAQSVVDGLSKIGSKAVDPTIDYLRKKMSNSETPVSVLEKAVQVLGNLKDQRALSILDELEKKANSRLAPTVDEAIKKIRGF